MRFACVAILLTLAPLGWAQAPPDQVAAEALFREAQRLYDEGKADLACPKFEGSYRLDPGLGTLLNVARCYEAVGRTASAWSAYIDLKALAQRAGQPDRETIATERIAALEPRLMRVVIRAASAADGLELTLDGRPLDATLTGTALPIDPGEHRLEARASGREPWSKTLHIDGEGGTTEVTIPTLVAIPTPAPPAPEPLSPDRVAPLEPATVDAADVAGSPILMIVGGVVAGAGLVVLAVGGGFAGDAASAWSDADCRDGHCATSEAQALSEQAGRSADTATGVVVAGGVLAAAGVAMLIAGAIESSDATLSANGLSIRF